MKLPVFLLLPVLAILSSLSLLASPSDSPDHYLSQDFPDSYLAIASTEPTADRALAYLPLLTTDELRGHDPQVLTENGIKAAKEAHDADTRLLQQSKETAACALNSRAIGSHDPNEERKPHTLETLTSFTPSEADLTTLDGSIPSPATLL